MMIRRVVGHSMTPHLKPGQLVLAKKVRRLKTGQIVIFKHRGLEKIKRISGLDGDSFTVIGDNPHESTDSRDFGQLPTEVIVARVIWPRK